MMYIISTKLTDDDQTQSKIICMNQWWSKCILYHFSTGYQITIASSVPIIIATKIYFTIVLLLMEDKIMFLEYAMFLLNSQLVVVSDIP